MGAVDWWAKKLGTQQPTQRSTPDTWNLPRHTTPTPGYEPHQQQYIPQYDALPVDENGQMHFMDGAVRWQGGEGTHTETQRCPKCHSGNYFSRKSEAKFTKNGAATPAPQCFNCGYNGIYTPFGGSLNSIAG